MLTHHQEHLYKLYKEIDTICKEHNIKYQLAGGTLIGAIRHRGFIPWDDDMDITMTRKEWKKFLKVCNDGALPENRVLECQENNRNYHNMVARYTDTSCTALHKTQLMHDDTAGFVIDILVYDGLPNKGEALKEYTENLMLYSDLLNDSLVYSYRYGVNAFRYLCCRIKMKFKGKDYVLRQLEEKMFRYDEDECEYLVLHWGGIPLVFDRKTFGDSSVWMPIEDTLGECPDRPFDYLVEHYGDEWMFIPPITEQQSHEAVFNTDIPYPIVRNEVYHFVNKDKVKRKYRMKKYIALSHMKGWQNLKDMNMQIRVLGNNIECKQMFSDSSEEIEKYRREKNYSALREIFGDYISCQNDRAISGRGDYSGAYRYFNPILVDIQKDMFELVLETLFNTGSISVAERFIEIYAFNKGEKTPFMQELESDIFMFRKAVSCFAAKEYDAAVPLIDRLIEKYPNNNSIIKLKINQYLKINGIENSLSNMRSLVEYGLKCFPNDGDLKKYLLDTEFFSDRENILIKYADVWFETYNGLVRLDIMDIIEENLDFFFDYCDKHIDEVIVEENEDNDIAENEEEYIEDSIPPKNTAESGEHRVSLCIIDKLIGIFNDSAKLYNKKFEILKKLADIAPTPEDRTERQHDLINCVLDVRKKYASAFRDNKYGEIETLITRWYCQYYQQINNSKFVTYTTAEVIACDDYNNLDRILDKIDKHMENLDKSSVEYLYCLELRGVVLKRMGERDAASRVFLECVKENKDAYLNRILRDDFNSEIYNIYSELYSSYNNSFIDKYMEIRGLTGEQAYRKSLNNKERLVNFYRKKIDSVYPNALGLIKILVKVGSVTEKESRRIIKKFRIKEDTTINLRIASKLCEVIDEIELKLDDDGYYLEEIEDSVINFEEKSQDNNSIF